VDTYPRLSAPGVPRTLPTSDIRSLVRLGGGAGVRFQCGSS